jgi:hypothetical protein
MSRLDEKENVHPRDEIGDNLTRAGINREDLFGFSGILSNDAKPAIFAT